MLGHNIVFVTAKKNKMKAKLILLIFLLLYGVAYATYDFSSVAPSGQTLYYIINLDDSTVSLYYPGMSYGYCDFEEPTGDVVIPETVTHNDTSYRVTTIGNYAFYNCSELTSVTIPNSVTLIGEGVFFYCSNLRQVSIPESVTNMGMYVFYSCPNLQSVVLPSALSFMGDGMFCSCSSLKELVVPELIEDIPLRCFYHCDSLRSVTLPEGLLSIGESAFSDCGMLDSVELPQQVTLIGNKAFYNCKHLKSIVMPQSLDSLGDEAFSFCIALDSIKLPERLAAIGKRAFYYCTGLKEITALSPIPPRVEDGAFYNVNKTIPVKVPQGSVEAYRVADGWNEFTNITDGTVSVGAEISDGVEISVVNGMITVSSSEDQPVCVFDIAGRMVFSKKSCRGTSFQLPRTGIYLVKIGSMPARKVFCKAN